MILSLVFFTFSFVFYILTTALYLGYWVFKKKWLGQTATAMAFVALMSTSMILISRAGESGHAPFSNLWESMMLFVWATNAGYLIMEYKHKFRSIGIIVMALESVAMLSALLLPYRFKSVEPLNPALQNKWHWMTDLLSTWGLEKYAIGWLDFHVFTTFIGYAGFAISFGLSILYLVKEKSETKTQRNSLVESFPPAKTLDELSYRAIAWGFPFLAVGIVSGAVWANYAWGGYWSWDPKETWALIVWLNYAAWLHMRLMKGLRGPVAAWWALVGLVVTTFAFLGVNMFLSGLHSYGEL